MNNKTQVKDESLSKGLGFIYEYLKKYKLSLLIVLLLIIGTTWLQVQAPIFMGNAINDLAAYLQSYFNPLEDSGIAHDTFASSVVKLVLAYLATSLGIFLYSFIMADVSSETGARIRSKLFSKLEALSIRFFDSSNEGDILSRFTNDIDNIGTLLNQAFIQIFSSIILLVSIAWTMMREQATLGSVVIGIALIAMVVVTFITRQAKKYVSVQQAKLGALNGYIDEKISGQKMIITTGTEEDTYKDFEPFNEEYRDTSKKGQAYSNILFPLVYGFSMLAMGSIIYFGASYVVAGTISVGLLVTFIQYVQRFFQPITQIVSQYSVFRLGITGAGRAQEIIDEPIEITNNEKDIKIDGIKEVTFKDVYFGYEADKPILKDINLLVEQGKKVALVGPTGSGKTTIINLINRFYDVTSGEIFIDQNEIRDINVESLRKHIGNVLQDSVLFSGTIKENISYGKEDASMDEIISAAKAAEIHEYIMSLPDGYDTMVDDSNSTFSVGQKQLLSIARTILTNPSLLILDEATSNVDTVTEQHIQKAMDRILEGRTSLVIAHRLKTILNADKIVVLRDGQIIEQGTNEELLKLNGFYADLYHNQFVQEDN